MPARVMIARTFRSERTKAGVGFTSTATSTTHTSRTAGRWETYKRGLAGFASQITGVAKPGCAAQSRVGVRPNVQGRTDQSGRSRESDDSARMRAREERETQ